MELLRPLPNPVPTEMGMDDDRELGGAPTESQRREKILPGPAANAASSDRREFHLWLRYDWRDRHGCRVKCYPCRPLPRTTQTESVTARKTGGQGRACRAESKRMLKKIARFSVHWLRQMAFVSASYSVSSLSLPGGGNVMTFFSIVIINRGGKGFTS